MILWFENQFGEARQIARCENKEEVEDPNGLHILLLDTEGMGQVSYYIDEGNNSDFNELF